MTFTLDSTSADFSPAHFDGRVRLGLVADRRDGANRSVRVAVLDVPHSQGGRSTLVAPGSLHRLGGPDGEARVVQVVSVLGVHARNVGGVSVLGGAEATASGPEAADVVVDCVDVVSGDLALVWATDLQPLPEAPAGAQAVGSVAEHVTQAQA